MSEYTANARAVLGDEEYERLIRMGDRILDMIPIDELRAHEGDRIAIDLRTGERRYFPSDTPTCALACAGPAWTSIVKIERKPLITTH